MQAHPHNFPRNCMLSSSYHNVTIITAFTPTILVHSDPTNNAGVCYLGTFTLYTCINLADDKKWSKVIYKVHILD